MPVPNIQIIFCESCGKLIKMAKFGDVLTPLEWERLNQTLKKKHCGKCKVKEMVNKWTF